MKLIVGLGNPGKKFRYTRHNVGFMVLDNLAKRLNARFRKNILLGAHISKKGDLILAKPYTFMNLSGRAVRRIASKFSLTLGDILVICDDCALNPLSLRLRSKGSSGGHKGLASIIEALASQDVARLRIGIGRPQEPAAEASEFVLSEFSEQELLQIEQALGQAADCALDWLKEDIQRVMSKYN